MLTFVRMRTAWYGAFMSVINVIITAIKTLVPCTIKRYLFADVFFNR